MHNGAMSPISHEIRPDGLGRTTSRGEALPGSRLGDVVSILPYFCL